MRALKNTLSKMPLIIRAVSLYCVIIAGVWGISLIGHTLNPTAIAIQQTIHIPTKPHVNSQQIISGEPVTFTIGRLNINLPVKNGSYDPATQEWTLSTDAVYFATITSRPNDNRGNTFIYGHNQDQVIARMKNIQLGDKVLITTSNGHTFTYAYRRDSIVAPDFTESLNENPNTPQLTVMTCEGVWSETRRMMYFDLVEVS